MSHSNQANHVIEIEEIQYKTINLSLNNIKDIIRKSSNSLRSTIKTELKTTYNGITKSINKINILQQKHSGISNLSQKHLESISNLKFQKDDKHLSYCNHLHIHQELSIGNFHIIELYFFWIIIITRIYSILQLTPYALPKLFVKTYTFIFIFLLVIFLTILLALESYYSIFIILGLSSEYYYNQFVIPSIILNTNNNYYNNNNNFKQPIANTNKIIKPRTSIELKPFAPANKFIQSKIPKLFKNISNINLQLQIDDKQISYYNPLHIHQELIIESYLWIIFKTRMYSFLQSLTYALSKLIIKTYTFIFLSISFVTILIANQFYIFDAEIRAVCNRLIAELGSEAIEIVFSNKINNILGPKIIH